MQLTPAQKTTLKTHLNANTNHALNTNTQFDYGAINTLLAQPFNGSALQAVADWYNALATAGDNQPFANINLWNPSTSVALLKKAIDWATPPPHGLGGSPTVDQQQLAINNQWWRWDSMLRDGTLDMTDPQVRAGVLQVWGNVTSPSSANSIGAAGCGKQAGKRVELALAGVPVGNTTAWAGAHVCPTNVINQNLSEPDIEDLLLNG